MKGRPAFHNEHLPSRPSWDCRACEKPWPCDPAREALVVELDPARLAMYCWTLLEEAVPEIPGATPADLFERFVKWTRR